MGFYKVNASRCQHPEKETDHYQLHGGSHCTCSQGDHSSGLLALQMNFVFLTTLFKRNNTEQWFSGLPRWANGKEHSCQCRRCKRCGLDPWVGKIPWRRARQPTPVFLPGESHRQRSLGGKSSWGCKELDMTEVT